MQKEYFNMGKESLSPNPSPNGEGSENYCLQIKGAFRWYEERLSS